VGRIQSGAHRVVPVCVLLMVLLSAFVTVDAGAGILRDTFNEIVDRVRETVEENNPLPVVVGDGDSAIIDDDRNLYQVFNNGSIMITSTGSPTELLAFRNYDLLRIDGTLTTAPLVGQLLNAGGDVLIRNGGLLRNNGSIRNSGTIRIRDSNLVNNGFYTNLTTLFGGSGSLSVGTGGTFTNNLSFINLVGDVLINDGGLLRNNGSIRNNGTIRIGDGNLVNNGFFTNLPTLVGENGSLSVGTGGTFTNNLSFINLLGDVSVRGELTNRGLIGMRRGTMNVSGVFYNRSADGLLPPIFSNVNGAVTTTTGALLVNGGVFSNRGGDASVESLGQFNNNGLLLNRSATFNVRDMLNNGLFANRSGGNMTISGSFANGGLLLSDEATLVIEGTFLNQAPDIPLIERGEDGVILIAPTLENLNVIEAEKLNDAFTGVTTVGDVVDGLDLSLSDISLPSVQISTLVDNFADSGFLVNTGGDLVVNGTLENQGFVLNRSERLGSRRAVLTVNGELDNNSAFFNLGATLAVGADGAFDNQGILLNRDKLLGSGRIDVEGTLSNDLYMSNVGGAVNVMGLLRNTGVFVNRAELLMERGQINVEQGGVLDNQGILINRNSGVAVGSAPGTTLVNGIQRDQLVQFDAQGNIDFSSTFGAIGTLLPDVDQFGTDLVLDIELLGIAETIADRAFLLNSGGDVAIGGSLENNSIFSNRSRGNVTITGTASNYGLLDNRNADLLIAGELENYATLTNRTSILGRGQLTVDGVLTNRLLTINRGADLFVNGAMRNFGALVNINKLLPNNAGIVTVQGELDNAGLIYNRGGLSVRGRLLNTATGVIFNTASPLATGLVTVVNEFVNYGFYLNKEGALSIGSDGSFYNYGLLRNRSDRGLLTSGATIGNSGELNNNAYLLNRGDLNTAGSLVNGAQGLLLNLGTLSNETGGDGADGEAAEIVNRGLWIDFAGTTTVATDYELPVTTLLPIDRLPFELPDVSVPLPSIDLLQASGNTTNSAIFANDAYMLNFGQFANSGILTNNSLLLNAGGGSVTLQTELITLTMETAETPEFVNSGSVTNTGSLANLGTLANRNELTNSGLLFNIAGNATAHASTRIAGEAATLGVIFEADGILRNTGSFTNNLLVLNAGRIENLRERSAGEETEPPGLITNLAFLINVGIDSPVFEPFSDTLSDLGGGDEPGATLSIGDVTLEVALTGTGRLTNRGRLDNGDSETIGTILNLGRLDNASTGVLSNRGVLINTPVGALDDLLSLPLLTNNFQQLDRLEEALPFELEDLERYFAVDGGATLNSGELRNTSQGLILSLGNFNNDATGFIDNAGIFSVASLARLVGSSADDARFSFSNAGEFLTRDGGQFLNEGETINTGTMMFESDSAALPSTFLNTGLLRNQGNLRFRDNSTFVNTGIVINAGTMQFRPAPFTNAGRVILASGSRIEGNVLNLGTLELAGTRRSAMQGALTSGPGSRIEVAFATTGPGRYQSGRLDVAALLLFQPDQVLLLNAGEFSFDHLRDNDRVRIISSEALLPNETRGPAALRDNRGNESGIWQFHYHARNLRSGRPDPGVDIFINRRRVRDIVNTPAAQAASNPNPNSNSSQPASREAWYTPAAEAVDALYDRNEQAGLGPAGRTVLSAFNSLATSEDIVAAVAQLTPAVVNSGTETVMRSFDSLNAIVANRISTTRQLEAPGPAPVALLASAAHGFNGLEAGSSLKAMQRSQAVFHGRSLWVKLYGARGEQDASADTDGYDSETSGIFFGFDAPLSDKLRLGAGFSYAEATIEQSGLTTHQDMDIDSYAGTVYADYLTSSELHLTFSGTLGRNRYDSRRLINFADVNEIARADYDGDYLLASATIGKSFPLSEVFTLHPRLGIEYATVEHESFMETDAGAFNQQVAADSVDSLVYNAHAILSYRNRNTLVNVYGGIGYDTNRERAVVDAAFGAGPTYTLDGVNPGKVVRQAGVGLVHHASDRLSLLVDYNLYDRDNYQGQTFAGTLRWAF
jgi:outer membrane autotransporter protein